MLCRFFGAWLADRVVAQELLRVLQPMALEATVAAELQRAEQQQELARAHELELVQARYEAQLAERRYAACDPANRLVASQLEDRWEEAICRVQAFEQKLDAAKIGVASVPVTGEFDGLAHAVLCVHAGGFPIVTGSIEGGVRHLIGDRMDRKGMR